MHAWAGTSGYSYKEWNGRFYPQKLPARDMLRFYAERFETVEINATFYRMPNAKVLAQWGEQVKEGFAFALKAPQAITHIKRLNGAEDATTHFLKQAEVLAQKLGPILFQLPPNMKKDLARLQAFLSLLPTSVRCAFEFRHASWFDEEVLGVLRDHRAALCIADDDKLSTPWFITADFGYLRLRRPEYTPSDIALWAERVARAPWKDAFVYFKHEDEAQGPELAERFLAELKPPHEK